MSEQSLGNREVCYRVVDQKQKIVGLREGVFFGKYGLIFFFFFGKGKWFCLSIGV